MKEHARQLYTRLGSYRKVGEVMGIHHSTIHRWLNSGQQPTPQSERKVSLSRSKGSECITSRGKGSTSLNEALSGLPEGGPFYVTRKYEERRSDGSTVYKWWGVRIPEQVIIDSVIPFDDEPSDNKKVLLIPDLHIGYLRQFDNPMEPIHDESALAWSLQIAAEEEPSVIIQLGDALDLAPWSLKWPRPNSVVGTTQASLQRCHDFFLTLRRQNPQAEIIYIEGNHEARIRKATTAVLGEASQLAPVGSKHGALSIPHLLNLDALKVAYSESHTLTDGTFLHHGSVVGSGGGATVAKILKGATRSTYSGHIHRAEIAGKRTPDGMIWAGSPGCLCRLDGTVPGSNPGVDWHHGLIVLEGGGGGGYKPRLILRSSHTVPHA